MQNTDTIPNESTRNRLSILYNFTQLISSFPSNNQFTIQNPDQMLLADLIRLWLQRKIYSDHQLLHLNLSKCNITQQIVKDIFQSSPSIVVLYNDTKIQNTSLIKTVNQVYYEGTVKSMLISNPKTGSHYIGEVTNTKQCIPHGYGTKHQNIGTKQQISYEGNFVNNKKQGFGIQIKKNYKYLGQWQNEQKNGLAIQFCKKKKKYHKFLYQIYQQKLSQFQSNTSQDIINLTHNQKQYHYQNQKSYQKKRQPQQKLLFKSTIQHQHNKIFQQIKSNIIQYLNNQNKQQTNNNFINNLLSQQKIKFLLKQYKIIYIGNFFHNIKSSQYSIQYTINGTYKGQWVNGSKNGKGIMIYNSGAKYDGEWKNNYLEGQGVYEDQAGNVYEGQFQGGLFEGEGTMKYINGDQYTGMWSEGRKHGEGVYTYNDGEFYDGKWVKDSAQGTGKSMVNGVYYEGQYYKGMKHGIGEQTDQDGVLTKGIWKNGEKIQIISVNGETV